MLRTLLLLGLCGVAWCQYDAPLPQRPVIPGAVAVGGGRGRVRPQVGRSRGLDEQDFAPRPRGRQPARAPRIRPALPPPPPPPPQPIFVQPKPVVEPLEELDSYDDDLAYQPGPSPPLPPTPPRALPTSPPRPPPTFRPVDDFPPPPRPQFRNTIQEEELDIPTRTLPLEPVSRSRPTYRTTTQAPSPPPPARTSYRQQQLTRPAKKESSKSSEEQDLPRGRKPVVQVVRKYREDNEDGSITWGFENDDGTYKEETIGTDCVTRGKYGYYDPEGVRREFTYSSGIPCDRRDQEDDVESEASDHGYVDYSNNRYVMANGDSVDLDHMVKNRARKPVQSYYRN